MHAPGIAAPAPLAGTFRGARVSDSTSAAGCEENALREFIPQNVAAVFSAPPGARNQLLIEAGGADL